MPAKSHAGVKLLRAFEGNGYVVASVAFHPLGEIMASGTADGSVQLWDVRSGKLLRTLEGHSEWVRDLAFHPEGKTLASGGQDHIIKIWDVKNGELLRTLEGHASVVTAVAFDSFGQMLASASHDGNVKLWDPATGHLIRTLKGDKPLHDVAFDPTGAMLASGSDSGIITIWRSNSGKLVRKLIGHTSLVGGLAFDTKRSALASTSADQTVKLWDFPSGRLLRTLEGHTSFVNGIAFSPDGSFLSSSSDDGTLRLWNCETWETVAIVPEPTHPDHWNRALAWHPTLALLAMPGSPQGASEENRFRRIHLWKLDYELLQRAAQASATSLVHHITGKIVLVGDHSVGKTALGYRLIYGAFKEQASTHGQHFWLFPALGKRRKDGTECEAILWDFAGQPDYRLVHALFVDNADLALVLFDASDLRDPLHGVGFWLKQLQATHSLCAIILVAAQVDRGSSPLTQEELAAFCKKHGIVGPMATSATTGLGIGELIERMKSLMPWEDRAATVTTTTFKRIKDYVLGLKGKSGDQIIVTPTELRTCLQATDDDWQFSDAEMITAVGHLENYGYVRRLKTSKGALRILLQPERLNNLASSLVLEARRNPKGLGALEEKRLLEGGYEFPELRDLTASDRDVLVDSAALLFIEHNVCFRETDPLRMEPYLVFPELINLKRPIDDDTANEDGAAYTVSGPTENVFASLVVLLGYTHTFTRTAQWQSNARYEMGTGLACGFRQEAERDGELDFVLSFGADVGTPVRSVFQGLFESFLARRNLTVVRYDPLRCDRGHLQNRAVVREAMQHGEETTFCSRCGDRLSLPSMVQPIQLTREIKAEVESQRQAAEQRTRFEQAVFRVRAYVAEQRITPPQCFISYAWGVPAHERWVEKRLATDLQKAAVEIVLDRWHNVQIGASVARFVARIEESDRIIMVGTPLYRQKYENKDLRTGYVVAAEVDIISDRLLGTESQKQSVLPVLLDGEKRTSLPPLLHGRVYADFRNEATYFRTAFDLILSLYQLPPNHPAVADLRESLAGDARLHSAVRS